MQIDSIGEGARGLVCRTDHLSCCNETSGAYWTTPNNTNVSNVPGNSNFYTDTGNGFIRLNLIRKTTIATGEYCCTVPVEGGDTNTFCVELFIPTGTNYSSLVCMRISDDFDTSSFYSQFFIDYSYYWWCGWCHTGSVTDSDHHYISDVVPEVSV